MVVAVMFMASAAFAATVGVVDVKEGLTVGVGYDNSESELDNANVNILGNSIQSKGNTLDVERVYVEASHGVTENFGVFAKVGEQQTEREGTIGKTGYALDVDDALFFALGAEVEYQLTGEAAAEVEGACVSNAKNELLSNISLFGQYQYTQANPDVDGIQIGNNSTSLFKGDLEISEHQFAAGLKKDVVVSEDVSVTPYGGVLYTQTNIDANHSIVGLPVTADFEQKDEISGFAGAELVYKKDYSVGGELQFGAQEGFGANLVAKVTF